MPHGRAHGLGLRKDGEICHFRVTPGARRGLYFRVRVFESRGMLQAAARRHALSVDLRCVGLCESYTRHRAGRITPEAGTIYLCRGWLGAGVVSHEATHAALQWGRRLGGLAQVVTHEQPVGRTGTTLTVDSPEEAFCYGVSAIVRQIYQQLYKRRVL